MKGPHICDCLCARCEQMGTGAFGPQPDGSAGVVIISGHVRNESLLKPGTAICWATTKTNCSLRGRIVAAVAAGTPPAEVAPELIGVKSTQLRFGDPRRPRCQDHYVVRREERNGRGVDHNVYYLPTAQSVQTVRKVS